MGDFNNKEAEQIILCESYLIYAIALDEADSNIMQMDWLPKGNVIVHGETVAMNNSSSICKYFKGYGHL